MRFRTSLPVLLVIKSLHFNPIKGVGRFAIILMVPLGTAARGLFKINFLFAVSTYITSIF